MNNFQQMAAQQNLASQSAAFQQQSMMGQSMMGVGLLGMGSLGIGAGWHRPPTSLGSDFDQYIRECDRAIDVDRLKLTEDI